MQSFCIATGISVAQNCAAWTFSTLEFKAILKPISGSTVHSNLPNSSGQLETRHARQCNVEVVLCQPSGWDVKNHIMCTVL